MPGGPGPYDGACERARAATCAEVIILVVKGGINGDGFEVSIDADRVSPAQILSALPAVLRELATKIEQEASGLRRGAN